MTDFLKPIVKNLTYLNIVRLAKPYKNGLKIVKGDIIPILKRNIISYLGHLFRIDPFLSDEVRRRQGSLEKDITEYIIETLKGVYPEVNEDGIQKSVYKVPELILKSVYVPETYKPFLRSHLQNGEIDERKMVILLYDLNKSLVPSKIVDIANKSLKSNTSKDRFVYAYTRLNTLNSFPNRILVGV